MSAARVAMVGRDAALRALRDAFESGRSGTPRAVVVAGEAGIGKTRLLQEFLAEIGGGSRVVVAAGQCVDLGPIGAPFTPIRRLFRTLYDAVGAEAFREAAQFDDVLATLASLIPELDSGSAGNRGAADYVAEAVERVLERLSARHHLVLVIEDMHWADAATLALLRTLALTLRGTRLTMVMTYRTDDVDRTHPLRALLSEFERSRIVTTIELPRLSPDETAEYVRQLGGDAIDAGTVEHIAQRSGGIPFFVEELVGLGEEALPDTLRELVLARADRLSPNARRVVDVLCAGGVHVHDAVLARVWTGDAQERTDGVREAIAAGVLIVDGEGFTFRHALIREALHDELLPGERLELHRAFARELQDRMDGGESGLAAATAEHWFAANDDAMAFRASVVALAEARAASAMATAAPLGERLLALWDEMPEPEALAGFSYGRLAADTVNLFEDLGSSARGRSLAAEALTRTLPDVERAELLLRSARGLSPVEGGWAASRRRSEAALELLGDDTSPQALSVRVGALTLLAQNPQTRDALALLGQAMVLAEASKDPDLIATVLRARSNALYGQIPAAELLADLRRAATLAVDPVRHFTIMTSLAAAHFHLRQYEQCTAVALAAYEDCVRLGLERGVGAFLLANAAESQLVRGDYEAGMATGRRAIALRPAQGFHSFAVRTLARAALWNDRHEDAAALVAQMDDTVWMPDDPDEVVGWSAYRTEELLLAAEAETGHRRRELVAEALIAIVPVFGEVAQNAAGVREEVLPTVAWVLRMAEEQGLDTDALSAPFARDIAESAVRAEALVVLALVAAEAVPLDAPDAVGVWRAAADAVEAPSATRSQRHYARFRLGQVRRLAGHEEQAVAVFAQVAAQASDDGNALLARWAVAGAPRARRSRIAHRAGSAATTLTVRENEVLALVAAGLSNPQIGERLFISPKTASVHVSAILAKIGAANRAEAAAWHIARRPVS